MVERPSSFCLFLAEICLIFENMNASKQEYARSNREWLAAKAKEEGVVSLSGGVCYKVIQAGPGTGASPKPHNVISCHYTGRTIDGKCFDTSLGNYPLAIRLRELIPGWIIALQQMHPGDKWELYIPSDMGYGKFSQPGIPANSTLIFEIELIAVQ